MANYEDALKGADRRSIGKSNLIAGNIHDQRSFDTLFDLLFHADRKVAMRAADAIEKITITNPSFIKQHKKKLLALFDNDNEIEMKWHLAQIIPRLELTKNDLHIKVVLKCIGGGKLIFWSVMHKKNKKDHAPHDLL